MLDNMIESLEAAVGRLKLRWIVGSMLVVGLLLMGHAAVIPTPPWLAGLGHKVGEAMFVAGMLAATVDAFVKRRLASEIVRDVSPLIMASSLPDALRGEVLDICNTRVYRQSAHIDYSLKPHDGGILLETKCESHFANETDRPQELPFVLAVERNDRVPHPLAMVTTEGMVSKGGPSDDLHRDAAGIENEATIEAGKELTWRRTLWVPPTSGETKLPRTIVVTRQWFPAQYFDIFFLMQPTMHVCVRAHYPEDMKVNVSFGHKRADGAVKWFPKDRPEQWDIHAAFLPLSVLLIEWRPVAPLVAPAK